MKSLLLSILSCLAVSAFISEVALAAPAPDVKLNSSDGPVVLKQSDTLTVSIAMDSGGATANCDWWFAIATSAGVFVMDSSGTLGSTVTPAYRGPLASFPSVTLLTVPLASVPGGTYTLYFGVDTSGNGALDMGSLYVDSATLIVVTPTAHGTPTGAATTQTIGPAGGTVSSADGELTVSIPAGALASDTPISMTPITNTSHTKTGRAFRLAPDGQIFNQPIQVVHKLSDQDLAGSDLESFTIAVQDSAGYWSAAPAIAYDSAAGTLTETTAHFSDRLPTSAALIIPRTASVPVNKSLSLSVMDCLVEDHGTSYMYDCENPNYERLAPVPATVDFWSVQGVEGGNSTVGTIAKTGFDAQYTAPAKVPQPNPVTVSAVYKRRNKGPAILFSDITVIDYKLWQGTAEVTALIGANVRQYRADVTFESFHTQTVPGISGPIVQYKIKEGKFTARFLPALEVLGCAKTEWFAAESTVNIKPDDGLLSVHFETKQYA